jgi:predicted DNA-binding transcriptional regulator AlpA
MQNTKLFILGENGVQELIPADQTLQNKENSFSFFDELKNSFLESQKPKEPEIKLLTIAKLIKVFDTTRPTLYNWISLGLLNPIKLAGRVYFKHSEIIQLIQDNSTKNQ